MTTLSIPNYSSKEEAYKDLDLVCSNIVDLIKEDFFLSRFKPKVFKEIEKESGLILERSMRNSDNVLHNFEIIVPNNIKFKIGTIIFSENSKSKGLKTHLHFPYTNLPTVTIGKKIFQGKDDVVFTFNRGKIRSINLKDDFVLQFNSCRTPHSVDVLDDEQSIWMFIVLEHCENVILEDIRTHFDCKEIYDLF